MNWKERERGRFADGTYTHIPWVDGMFQSEETKFHFPHVSLKDKTLIAYTISEENGKRDIQTPIKPGRYLKKFYGHILDEITISEMCAHYRALHDKPTLLIAHTPEEIQYVYENGPRSCMSSNARDWPHKTHPTCVYGAGDLAIAYCKRKKNINARVVCWPEKKLYIDRVYGDDQILRSLLHENKFSLTDNFWGARILRVDFLGKEKPWLGKFYIMPHFDFYCQYDLTENENIFIIDEKGTLMEHGGMHRLHTQCSVCKKRKPGAHNRAHPVCIECRISAPRTCFSCKTTIPKNINHYTDTRGVIICYNCVVEKKMYITNMGKGKCFKNAAFLDGSTLPISRARQLLERKEIFTKKCIGEKNFSREKCYCEKCLKKKISIRKTRYFHIYENLLEYTAFLNAKNINFTHHIHWNGRRDVHTIKIQEISKQEISKITTKFSNRDGTFRSVTQNPIPIDTMNTWYVE